ncbi:MAG: hypothetical protein D6B26_03585 [Spirochaetaceae bacterium]|nr:MAG: hypothetical protein D6B26_03585 [Spirochaetaceae bacterium]
MMRKVAGFWLGVLVVAAVSCSLDYDYMEEEAVDVRPEVEITRLQHTVVRSGRTRFRIHAMGSKTWQEEKRQVLEEVYFWEYNQEGELAAEGRADFAEIMLETEDIRFSGAILLYSYEEEAGIEAAYLEWNAEERRLQGNDGEEVIITRDDGTTIAGVTFLADMRLRSLAFDDGISGVYVDEQADEQADNQIEE